MQIFLHRDYCNTITFKRWLKHLDGTVQRQDGKIVPMSDLSMDTNTAAMF